MTFFRFSTFLWFVAWPSLSFVMFCFLEVIFKNIYIKFQEQSFTAACCIATSIRCLLKTIYKTKGEEKVRGKQNAYNLTTDFYLQPLLVNRVLTLLYITALEVYTCLILFTGVGITTKLLVMESKTKLSDSTSTEDIYTQSTEAFMS